MKKQIMIILPFLGLALSCLSGCSSGVIELHTKEQLGYINDASYTSIAKYTSGTYVEGNPLPVTLSLKSGSSYLLMSEKEDFSDHSWSFEVDGITKYELFNCKSGTTYYWKTLDSSKESLSSIKSFSISDKYPRHLYVDGVKNVRDLGYKGYIKQGLIYRGGEFDYLHASAMKNNITEEGKTTLLEQLRIKTEIDLRFTDESKGTTSALGDAVNYCFEPMYYKGSENILTYTSETADNPGKIKNIFSLLADEQNYPLYFHCAKGKDRTGLISYLLKGLLGQDENEIYKDYLFTNFTYSNAVDVQNIIDSYVANIKASSGELLKDKISHYLQDTIGVSGQEISSIISILQD